MKFYPEQIFHIFNQGNNRRKIFFSDENYEYFLWKMRAYLEPFGNLVTYCLMPNHFHWQFYVKEVEIKRYALREHVDKIEYQRRRQKYGLKTKAVKKNDSRVAEANKTITLNDSIGILQKTYTRAINKEKQWSGSLFRSRCKAKDGWIDEFITIRKPNGSLDSRFLPGTDYAYKCLCYIHDNPLKAGLVKKSVDWKYSSAQDYAGLRNGTMCNLELGRQIIEFM